MDFGVVVVVVVVCGTWRTNIRPMKKKKKNKQNGAVEDLNH
jgi:hypothetical protein